MVANKKMRPILAPRRVFWLQELRKYGNRERFKKIK